MTGHPSGGHARRVAEPTSIDLTPREREVLRLIADGHSTKELAHKLGITFRTAASHRSNIMQKLDVHRSASLVRHAIRLRLIDP